MSGPAPRSPTTVGFRLWATLVGLAALQALLVCVAARSVFVAEAPGRVVVCGRVLLLATGSVALLALAVGEMIRRTAPLYRAARRAQRDDVPPSQAALRDALSAPVWLTAASAGPWLLAAVADAVSGGRVSGLAAGQSLPLVLFVVSSSVCLAVVAGALARGAVEPWLAAFRPDQQVLHDDHVWTPPVSLLVSVPVAGFGGVAVAVCWALHPGVPTVVAAALAAAVAGGTWALARGAQARLDADERLLATRLDEAAESLHGRKPAPLEMSRGAWRTAEVSELAAAVEAMSRRYAALALEEHMARASVQQLQRSKMLFMASMSHDLRSPLNSILGFGELLQQTGRRTFNDAQRESVRLIARSGEELLRLLNDVLDSARHEAGRLQLRRDWTPSVEILTEAVRQAREVVEDEQLEIVAEMQPGLPPVYVDRERIVQAVLGLFRHAARAMSGGTIRMYARVAPDPVTGTDQLRVDVLDRGGGIRDEDRERIFEAFREVTSVSGRRIGGLGLTLSLARALVRAHEGDVWIDNEPGRGTTFTVAIPVAPPDQLSGG